MENFLDNIKMDQPLTPEQEAEARAVLDPTIWCETILRDPENQMRDLSLRTSQKKVLSHQQYFVVNEKNEKVLRNRIKVLRMGRRLGKTVVLAAEALWKACTNNGCRVLYIAPFESQCTVFFGMIEKMLTNAPIKPTAFRQKPYFVKFANGSQIVGHTANVRSSRKGSSIRGAEGDHIIIDEMDYGIDDVINEVIMPIYIGNNLATVTAASTPTGRRGLFWLWCTNGHKMGIREFHHTSQESPKWNSESEEFCKRTMTQSQYIHEILANFGEELEGVFKNKDLDSCMRKYDYKDCKYNSQNLYVMGVDWNEKYGVSIVIVERSRKTGLYRVFRHEKIEKQELTQLTGVSRIVDIHLKEVPCNFIYVDHGFGATQIELLKKYGMDNPDSKLYQIVKDIEYGGKIITKDPVTKEEIERPAKPFLVHNTQMVVENHQIFMPEEEDTDFGIIGQMRNFRVSKFSSTGNPVYEGKLNGQDNDHSLNSLFLALMGFMLELAAEAKIPITTQVASIMNFHIPRAPARDEVPSENITRFMDIMKRNAPNLKHCVDISSLAQKGVGGKMRGFGKPRLITRTHLPQRRSF